MWRRDRSRTAVVGGAVAIFVVCCLLPIVYLLVVSLSSVEGLSALLLDRRQHRLLSSTAVLGICTALLATVIGAPLGVVLARTAVRRKAVLRLVLAAPVLLPPYIVALAWTFLGGSHSPLSRLIGPDMLRGWTYSTPAAVLVLSAVFYPISMLTTEVAMRRVDGRLEEAAALLAPPGRVLRRITLPLVAPSIVAAGLIIFVLTVSEFGVPALLRVPVYTTEVFTAFAALYDFQRAILLTAPLLLVCGLVATIAVGLLGNRLSVRRATAARPLFLARRPAAMAGAVFVILLALVVPLAILVEEALRARSLTAIVADSAEAIVNSLVLAAAGATAVVAAAIGLGYARARAAGPIGRLADVLFVAVFAAPSTVVSVGLIGLWNRPGPLGMVYGTDVMLLLGYMARFLPVAALVVAASTRAVSSSQEEAASIAGSGWLRTMWRIVLPQIRLGSAVAWVIVFVLAFGELGVSIMVAPPGEATLPIRVYTIIANTPASHVAALALLQAAVVFVPLAVLAAGLSRVRTDD